MILLQETISAESITAVTFPGVFSFQKPFLNMKFSIFCIRKSQEDIIIKVPDFFSRK